MSLKRFTDIIWDILIDFFDRSKFKQWMISCCGRLPVTCKMSSRRILYVMDVKKMSLRRYG